ncbi:YicC family protein [Pseudorhodobacter sp. E13]|uniref:YicC/YloC family endoribonuclease n=1 Tax=Pseudorhodobacter sp. E13 TaxID=2487931 RepID=UPI000F8DE4D1|nr:YicC/YloC family endoribonuclease [Pseudorhodobacter sp. E13]RUS59130.1 YicC family protein [Pseudorhodobacter sp. E13]
MTLSMTGFATRRGQHGAHAWVWDIRSVNGKGLDLRMRVPDWIDGLEAQLRAALGKALNRGNVNLTLKLSRSGAEESSLRLNPGVLRSVLVMLAEVEQQAMTTGVTLAQASQADVLGLRGVLETATDAEDTAPLAAALMADFADLLAELQAMRAAEGQALQAVVQDQLDQIETLVAAASDEAAARQGQVAATLKDNVKKLLQAAESIDENRLHQELALLAVKADVTEELDRLRAHTQAARALIVSAEPVGRKLDFLMQEFMREANTLCSKAQALALTRVGLDLKTVIDQMREQVQNVE